MEGVRARIEEAYRRGELKPEDRDRLLRLLEESPRAAETFLNLLTSLERLRRAVAER
jgi:anti-sigma factor RsiW